MPRLEGGRRIGYRACPVSVAGCVAGPDLSSAPRRQGEFRLAAFVRDFAECVLQSHQLLFRHFLEIEKAVSRRSVNANEFVELQLHRLSVAVLAVLNQEDHQKGHDGRSGIDDQLPRIGKSEERTHRRPDHDEAEGSDEGMSPPRLNLYPARKTGKKLVHGRSPWPHILIE